MFVININMIRKREKEKEKERERDELIQIFLYRVCQAQR